MHLTISDAKKYEKEFNCPECGDLAIRIMSATNFTFKTGKTPGNSGVYGIDYNADIAVGRSAAKKWEKVNQEKNEKDKARKEFGTNALRKTENGYAPLTKEQSVLRDKAFTMLKKPK